MSLQAKKQSFWTTFKKAYLKSRDLKSFWRKFDKSNLSKELVEIFNAYIASDSYIWLAKHWHNNIINHLEVISIKKDYDLIFDTEYFTVNNFNDEFIESAWKQIKEKNIKLDVNLFKKQSNYSITQSINHNIILLLLYEIIKDRKVFNNIKKINKVNKNNFINKPSLVIEANEITQDDLNSLLEFEKIEKLLNKTKNKKNKILEIGAGSGRTAQSLLSIIDNVKYVIADVPPAIYFSLNNLKKCFPNKKILTAFDIQNENDINLALDNCDVLFIFPHQIKLFDKKTFDITLAIDCLHEMEKKVIKVYMGMIDKVSQFLYFKVWENSGLNYSFFEHHKASSKSDYSIKDTWVEHLNEKCLYPSNYAEFGYELK